MWEPLEFSINEPDTWQFSLIGQRKRKSRKYIQLAEAKNKKTISIYCFDKKSGNMWKYSFYDINLAHKPSN
jgi:hypothetical protein